MFKLFINSYDQHINTKYISHDCNSKEINQLIFLFDSLRCNEKFYDHRIQLWKFKILL